ncbi:cytochrome P450 [Archangium gephyra]|uniref:Cytochrome P450 n=1 Tax=Archangium gephyra TaxID=48 RepID=A0AAC8TF47_9BACT|nr:cytochrome P450 [Archangium gephyra]AKJ03677.1 putative cytochrome P450 hydroxylase [Archangium gephyra]REG22543.1 cytochrome P450 [Archangium gephyra]
MSLPVPQFTPEVTLDPYPFYAALREAGPVPFVPSLMGGCYALTRQEDILSVLKNPVLFSSKLMAPSAMMPKELGEDVLRLFQVENNLLTSAPPLHTRLRTLVSRAFTPRRVAELEPRIRKLCGELLDTMLAREEFDLIPALAAPLPVIVITEMLGVEPERRPDFKRWSDDVMRAISLRSASEDLGRLRESILEFHAYLETIVERRRREPRNDLISAIIEASEAEGGFLSTLDIMAFTRLLLINGNETSTHLISNGMVALLRHPSEWERLTADPSLLPNAIEEMLRYDSPGQAVMRLVTEDTELAGHRLPKGSRLLLLLGAANRDPHRFPEPDRFDVTREVQGLVSFGHGIHFCLGAPLARLEAKVVFEELFRRVRRVSFAPGQEGTIPWNPALFIRGPKSLRLRAERHPSA